MNLYWTSLKPINGLRHFVCVNELLINSEIKFLLVSVIDIEVNLIVSKNELENSGFWKIGWLEINKSDSIINLRNDYTPQIDSLYYELIRYLGLISLFFLVLFVLNRYYFKSYFYRPQFAVSIILISGFFEGLFYKITPIVLFLTCVILENFLLKNKLSK